MSGIFVWSYSGSQITTKISISIPSVYAKVSEEVLGYRTVATDDVVIARTTPGNFLSTIVGFVVILVVK